MPNRLDRVLIAAAVVLVAIVGWDALAHRTAHPRAVESQAAPPPAAAVPQLVRLVPSSTAFLPNCPAHDLHLTVGPGAALTLRFAGRRCHVPPLGLQAVLQTPAGGSVYHGPALASEALSGNYAGSGQSRAALLGCPSGARVVALVFGSGLRARGRIRCP